jgi:hypothetical protein
MQPVADLTQYGPHPVQPTTIQTATFPEATAVVIDRVGYGHFYQCPLGSITKHARSIVNATIELRLTARGEPPQEIRGVAASYSSGVVIGLVCYVPK